MLFKFYGPAEEKLYFELPDLSNGTLLEVMLQMIAYANSLKCRLQGSSEF